MYICYRNFLERIFMNRELQNISIQKLKFFFTSEQLIKKFDQFCNHIGIYLPVSC